MSVYEGGRSAGLGRLSGRDVFCVTAVAVAPERIRRNGEVGEASEMVLRGASKGCCRRAANRVAQE